MFTMNLSKDRTRLIISAFGLVKEDVPGEGYVPVASVSEDVELTREDVAALVHALDNGSELRRDRARVRHSPLGVYVRLGDSISISPDPLSDHPELALELFRDQLGTALDQMQEAAA